MKHPRAPTSTLSSAAIHYIADFRDRWQRWEKQVMGGQVQTTRDMVHYATLYLSCRLCRFDSRLFDSCYDTAERPSSGEIVCLPILSLANAKVHRMTGSPQLHGVLLVLAPTAAMASSNGASDVKADEATDCYRRVGYFWARVEVSKVVGMLGETRTIRLI